MEKGLQRASFVKARHQHIHGLNWTRSESNVLLIQIETCWLQNLFQKIAHFFISYLDRPAETYQVIQTMT